ncbi:EAL domain-containing protein [Arthrobacter sp. FW306-04-A]|uniref:sensor domain-containing protein n=1 Tax=Arthrobacter sp. FW306-04-A TaxID=2879619 RepID=UPI0037BEBC20|nr:EAL domain-containing protein [Arthrobacter sp. FW306-04-A]
MTAEDYDDLLMQSLLLEEIGQSVIALDRSWRVVYWNRASERLYGYSAGEVRGRKITELSIIAGPEATGGEIADTLTSGRTWSGEYWMRHRDGRKFPIHATVAPVRGTHPVPMAVVAVSKDISERKHAEALLRRMSALVESSGDAIIGADLDGTVTSWNAGAARMFGWRATEALGRNYRLLTTDTDKGFREEVLAHLQTSGVATGVESRWKRKDGTAVDVSLTVSPVFDDHGQRVGGSVIARDITELKRLQSEADRERVRLIAAQEIAHVGSVEFDYGTGRWWHSEEYTRLIGGAPDELPSKERILSLAHPDDCELLKDVFRRLEAGEQYVEYEFRILTKTGSVRWLHARTRVFQTPDGQPSRLLVTVMDITERKRAQEILEHQAFHDGLTGLPNRFLLAKVLQDLLDRRCPQVVVMFVDVDRFKLVNDGIGHGAGDAILIQLGERIRASVRKADTVGRFGGDEFIVVCEDLNAGDAAAMAERIRAATREGFDLDGRRIYLNVSIGIASAGEGDTAESVLSGADAAMYAAKTAGGDRTEIYDLEPVNHLAPGRQVIARLDLESDLRTALERGQMHLEYQPIIELASGNPIGFEALLRWVHPSHGRIPPNSFIPVAEETGLIVPIGAWVINQALTQAQRWRESVPGMENVSIAVNISVRQLLDPGFLDVVFQAIFDSGIDPAAVSLEITESVLMEQRQFPMDTLRELDAQGIRLSIDDFGTGYSSLSYLKWLFARVLKIDRTFIEELGNDPQGATLIELILGTARSYGLDVIAEGVETQAQLDELVRLGVPKAQGYFWHRPMPAAHVPRWAAQSRTEPGVSAAEANTSE